MNRRLNPKKWSQLPLMLLVAALIALLPHSTWAQPAPDALLDQAARQLDSGAEAANETLNHLGLIKDTLSSAQKERYLALLLSYYAFRGMYHEQIATSERELPKAGEPNLRATLLYYLSDGYTNLGDYEKALRAMNESILLLPRVSDLRAKMSVLQAAVTLLNSLGAYDDSLGYARRIETLSTEGGALPQCVGLTDEVEIAFLRQDPAHARTMVPKAIEACNAGTYQVLTLEVKALDATDRLADPKDVSVLPESLELIGELSKENERFDYTVQLTDAIARRYLSTDQFLKAEQFASRAVQLADAGNAVVLKKQAHETMAAILRAEGRIDQALKHMDISRLLWSKMLEERSQKDIVYQRMKFEAQDQSNQLRLLEKINKLLVSEKELQGRNAHILELLVFVTGLLLAFVSVSLFRMWRQKNDFRTFSQMDGLTKISNRAHFIACAHETFKDARGGISIVVFDMDEFKLINDTYGHAAGDWVLKTISSSIASCLRAHDMFGRLGGEEFAICLPRTSEQEAMALAERCRAAIESIDSTPSGHQFTLSASFGIAVRPPGGAAGFEEVLAAADRVLYQAKHMGRNRIVPYGEVFGHTPLVA